MLPGLCQTQLFARKHRSSLAQSDRNKLQKTVGLNSTASGCIERHVYASSTNRCKPGKKNPHTCHQSLARDALRQGREGKEDGAAHGGLAVESDGIQEVEQRTGHAFTI